MLKDEWEVTATAGPRVHTACILANLAVDLGHVNPMHRAVGAGQQLVYYAGARVPSRNIPAPPNSRSNRFYCATGHGNPRMRSSAAAQRPQERAGGSPVAHHATSLRMAFPLRPRLELRYVASRSFRRTCRGRSPDWLTLQPLHSPWDLLHQLVSAAFSIATHGDRLTLVP